MAKRPQNIDNRSGWEHTIAHKCGKQSPLRRFSPLEFYASRSTTALIARPAFVHSHSLLKVEGRYEAHHDFATRRVGDPDSAHRTKHPASQEQGNSARLRFERPEQLQRYS